MKVILNRDLATLGEEGDVKDVAKGYARNYLFPREIAVPYTSANAAVFEARRDEIEKRKEQKRRDAGAVKERIEALTISLTMPATATGKLFGAVSSLTIAEELEKQGFHIERKKIEIPGSSIKNVGSYKALVKLYGNEQAQLTVAVTAKDFKPPEHEAKKLKPDSHAGAEPGDGEATRNQAEAASSALPPEGAPETVPPSAV